MTPLCRDPAAVVSPERSTLRSFSLARSCADVTTGPCPLVVAVADHRDPRSTSRSRKGPRIAWRSNRSTSRPSSTSESVARARRFRRSPRPMLPWASFSGSAPDLRSARVTSRADEDPRGLATSGVQWAPFSPGRDPLQRLARWPTCGHRRTGFRGPPMEFVGPSRSMTSSPLSRPRERGVAGIFRGRGSLAFPARPPRPSRRSVEKLRRSSRDFLSGRAADGEPSTVSTLLAFTSPSKA